jgi:hypothetical protein
MPIHTKHHNTLAAGQTHRVQLHPPMQDAQCAATAPHAGSPVCIPALSTNPRSLQRNRQCFIVPTISPSDTTDCNQSSPETATRIHFIHVAQGVHQNHTGYVICTPQPLSTTVNTCRHRLSLFWSAGALEGDTHSVRLLPVNFLFQGSSEAVHSSPACCRCSGPWPHCRWPGSPASCTACCDYIM